MQKNSKKLMKPIKLFEIAKKEVNTTMYVSDDLVDLEVDDFDEDDLIFEDEDSKSIWMDLVTYEISSTS
jgi:hypothetical protein